MLVYDKTWSLNFELYQIKSYNPKHIFGNPNFKVDNQNSDIVNLEFRVVFLITNYEFWFKMWFELTVIDLTKLWAIVN